MAGTEPPRPSTVPRPFTSLDELRTCVDAELPKSLPPDWRAEYAGPRIWTIRPTGYDRTFLSGYRLWFSDDLSVFCLTFGNSDAGPGRLPAEQALAGQTALWRFHAVDLSLSALVSRVLGDQQRYPQDRRGLS